MNIYVASGLPNREMAAALMTRLRADGHSITYDWTQHGDVRGKGEAVMQQTACNESDGVLQAELVIVLLPGGSGTHTELGMALASRANKRIWLCSPTGKELGGGPETCVFYHHPAIERMQCDLDALCARVRAL